MDFKNIKYTNNNDILYIPAGEMVLSSEQIELFENFISNKEMKSKLLAIDETYRLI